MLSVIQPAQYWENISNKIYVTNNEVFFGLFPTGYLISHDFDNSCKGTHFWQPLPTFFEQELGIS